MKFLTIAVFSLISLIGIIAMPQNAITGVTLNCTLLKVLESDFIKSKSQMDLQRLEQDQSSRLVGTPIESNVIVDLQRLFFCGLNYIFTMQTVLSENNILSENVEKNWILIFEINELAQFISYPIIFSSTK